MTCSKLNGKALYYNSGDSGLQVEATERNDDDDRQHWKRKDSSYIVSKKWNKIFHKQPATHLLFLVNIHDDLISTRSSDANARAMFAHQERKCKNQNKCMKNGIYKLATTD